jgi:hypothetical protein
MTITAAPLSRQNSSSVNSETEEVPAMTCDSSTSTVSSNMKDPSAEGKEAESETENESSYSQSDDEKSERGDSDDEQEHPRHTIPPQLPLIRLVSSHSVGSESQFCPICLDPMTPIDHDHPLLCPTRHCHYNFCLQCIESLLSSSKDDYEMASDGNAHVKIYLNCPNCRADLSTTIRDVLLLRKVDTVTWLTEMHPPPTLTPSQQRTQKAMQEIHVQEAIQQARETEEQFWKTHHHRRDSFVSSSRGRDDSDDEDHDGSRADKEMHRQLQRFEVAVGGDDEEWGVEADLVSGVHDSFRMPADQELPLGPPPEGFPTSGRKVPLKKIDPTILQGLEFSMTHAEKLQVTSWMTSGDVNSLARAATLLQELEHYARQGITPSQRQRAMNRRASVYEIVEEARQVHENQSKKQSQQQSSFALPPTAPTSRISARSRRLAAEQRQLDIALEEQALLVARFPLPVRMPKCIELDLRDPTSRRFPLEFCNDTWDGTVLDAYSKLTISVDANSEWMVTKKKTQHAGVFHVLSLGQYKHHYGSVEMSTKQPPRVLVASVQGEAGRQGVIKGDVVTHVDGQEIQGQTVEELIALIQAKVQAQKETQQEKVRLILNAEPAIAEALRRRALVLE